MGLVNKWVISCATAANLTGKSHSSSLNWSEKIKLKYHTSMCEICRRYKKQQDWIDHALKTNKSVKMDNSKADILKEKIVDKINNQ
jgi:hypothetical protein